MRQFTAGPNDEGVRLSRFVLQVTCNLPSSLLYKSFRNKRIKVNGKKGAPDTRLACGDVVELYINDEFFADKTPQATPGTGGQQPNFDIVWQDENIAILYKPAGVLSHSDITAAPTLLSAFTAHLTATGEYRPEAENAFAPALCNRLDRGTEGLVIAAKNYAALRDMNEIIRLGLLDKSYLAVTAGVPPEGDFHAWLCRDKAAKRVTVTAQEIPGAKPIETIVRVQQQANGLALCEIGLITGRTHQIRAHLAFLGVPVLGDAKYGDATLNHKHHLKTQLLCAYKLTLAPQLLPANTLAYLAGRTFTAEYARLPQLWEMLSR